MGTIHIEEKNETTLPELITSFSNREQVTGISYISNGKKYIFSNELGHKVTATNGYDQRPMTKTEFKEIRAKMACSILKSPDLPEKLVEELEKLDFSIGHANGTFEVVTACMSASKVSALVINLGNARYIYNQDANTVFHIDHSKLINGEEKTRLIDKITTSKTMAKKLTFYQN